MSNRKNIYLALLFLAILLVGAFLLLKKDKALVLTKNVKTVQLTAVAGESIKWQKLIPVSVLNNGQHLLELPHNAEKIKITPVKDVKIPKVDKQKNLSVLDRKILSARSKTFEISLNSLALVKEFSQTKGNYSKSIGFLASAGEAFDGVLEAILVPDPVVVDIAQVVPNTAETIDSTIQDNLDPTNEESTPPPAVVSSPLPTGEIDTSLIDATNTANINTTDVPVEENSLASSSSLVSDSFGSVIAEEIQTESSPQNSTNTPLNVSSTTAVSTSLSLPFVPISSVSANDISGPAITRETQIELSSQNSGISASSSLLADVALLPVESILVEYETSAPVIAEAKTKTGKIVSISAEEIGEENQITNVLAFTNIPEIYKVGQENKIKIKWLNENGQEMAFKAYDLNNNGKLDYIEWTVPHLSTQTFEIIFISKALEFNADNEIVADIYDQVKEQDGDWAQIPDGHFIKVTFEKFLTTKNDITLYARSSLGASIEVYNANTNQLIATFPTIAEEKIYKILLTNLDDSTDVFDLRVIASGATQSSGVDIDYIVDPSPVTVTDSFTDETKIASKLNVTINTTDGQVVLSTASTWACGDALVDSRDGKQYGTVLIGSQCWMQQNLNVGTLVLGSATQSGYTGTTCGTIQRYCYTDEESNCGNYGGLYQWNQAMCGSLVAGSKGICPTGWHIPTHNEFTLLELTTCSSGSCVTDFPYDLTTTGWRGTNEGTTLKDVTGSFRGLLSGGRGTSGSFVDIGTSGYFWSSVESGTYAWRRDLNSGVATVSRGTSGKAYGFSVRCLKD